MKIRENGHIGIHFCYVRETNKGVKGIYDTA